MTSGAAFAQSTVGTIYGNADAGATVQAQNLGSGQVRSTVVGEDGRFSLGSLAPGKYVVTSTENGQATTHNVQVVAGQGFNLNLVSTGANAQELGAVQVSANTLPAIDVSSVETTTVFTAEQLKALPVARDQNAVALLAPGTVKGDASINGITVFNGASGAENSYYVNGFNVTNQFQTLTYSKVPFEGIAQEEVKSGGYGAQYGFSTGGVISVITKRGTNQWTGGADVYYTPAGLSGHNPTRYQKDGELISVNNKDEQTQTEYNVWFGGPLVKDRLFFYGLYQARRTTSDSYGNYAGVGENISAGGSGHYTYEDPLWLVKLDWNINDNNILEYTGFNSKENQEERVYRSGATADFEPTRGEYQGTVHNSTGGQTNILKYTGYLTDSFTLTAQYGKLKYSRDNYAVGADGLYEAYNGVVGDFNQPGCATVRDGRVPVSQHDILPAKSCDWAGALDKRGGGDTRKAGRIDLEWRVGDHDVKAGYADDKWNSDTGNSGYEGGVYWTYYTRNSSVQYDDAGNRIGYDKSGSPESSYVRQVLFQTGASVDIDQKSYYLEDYWNVTDQFLLYLGLRNDSFANKSGGGETYVKQDNIWQPRLGFSWDVNGDSSLKIYGSAGDYSLPIAANVALRAASASIYRIRTYYYTSIDPVTGVPSGLSDPEPGETSYDTPYIANGEDGSVPNPKSVADKNLKPYRQREFILGFDKQIAENWTVGVKAMYRKVLNVIDDDCDWRPFHDYAVNELGMDPDTIPYYGPPSGTPGCWLFNPGRGTEMDIDLNGDHVPEHVKLSAADLGNPKAQRSFGSLEFSLEHQWDNHWFMKASYVWSHSFGNTEGLVNTTLNQTDTGTTEDWDFPEFAWGANGSLPNDRTHTLKVYGAYQFTDEWRVGANLLAQTGRPISCIGYNKAAYDYAGYGDGDVMYYCNGKIVPRGTAGRTPVLWNLDLSVSYQPHWLKGLTLAADVNNVFNSHTATEVSETAEDAYGNYYSTTYRVPTSYQQPRYVRFMAQYDFSL
jgi:hypothetical protein